MRGRILIFLAIFFMSEAHSQFLEGAIVDKYGKAYPGFIKLPVETDHFNSKTCNQTLVYKETKKSNREQLSVADVRAFKAGADSFLVVKNYSLPLDDITHNVFAKVDLKGPNGILCSFTELKLLAGNPSTINTYVTRKETIYLIYRDKQFTPLTDYNFSAEMPALIADHPALSKKILSKELQFEDMEEIIEIYSN